MAGIDDAVNAAKAAGFSGSALETIVAIAGAESGFNASDVCNDCFPGVHELSVGMWQINILAHPEYTQAQMMDVNANARAAFAISSAGLNFTPWSVYPSKSNQFIAQAKSAIANNPGSGALQSGINLVDCVNKCQTDFPETNDATDAFNAVKRQGCIAFCQTSGLFQGTAAPGTTGTACKDCAINNLAPCFKCLADAATRGLVAIATNIFWFVILLVGVYLLFRPEINAQMSKVKDNLNKLAVAAAESGT